MNESNDYPAKNLGIFSTLHAATETRFFLLSAAFVLLVDNIFIQTHQPSIFELLQNKSLLEASNLTLKVILIFVGFSFLTSLMLPIVARFAEQIWLAFGQPVMNSMESVWRKIFPKEELFDRRHHNHVYPSDLRSEADETHDKYYIDLYLEYQEKWLKNLKESQEHALFSFYCLFMLIWNNWLSAKYKHTISITLANYFGIQEYAWIAIFILFMMFIGRFLTNDQTEQIYCPALYKKIQFKHQQLLQNQNGFPRSRE